MVTVIISVTSVVMSMMSVVMSRARARAVTRAITRTRWRAGWRARTVITATSGTTFEDALVVFGFTAFHYTCVVSYFFWHCMCYNLYSEYFIFGDEESISLFHTLLYYYLSNFMRKNKIASVFTFMHIQEHIFSL